MEYTNTRTLTQISVIGKIEDNYSEAQLKMHASSFSLINTLSQDILIEFTNNSSFYSEDSLKFNFLIITPDVISNEEVLPGYTKIAERFDIQPLNLQPIIVCKPVLIPNI